MNTKYIWAKANENSFHPLSAHMIDVSNVAQLLWNYSVPESIKGEISTLTGASKDDVEKMFSTFAGLHDIGKATPGFQKRNKDLYKIIEESNDKISGTFNNDKKHDFLSYLIINNWKNCFNINRKQRTTIDFLAKSLYAHHGIFLRINNIIERDEGYYGYLANLGNDSWRQLQFELIKSHLDLFGIRNEDIPYSDKKIEKYLPFIAGWITLSDWIGSDEYYFNYLTPEMDIDEYLSISKERAKKAVDGIGLSLKPMIISDSFHAAFPEIENPRALQTLCSTIKTSENNATLTIIEAPTGDGKTEAALHLAQRLLKQKSNRGIYVAMPTQATSKGLFDRFESFCKNVDSMENPNIKLIHGGAILDKLIEKQKRLNYSSYEINDNRYEWFTQRKRALLSTYGVGTVDQSFFSVLLVKHFFLRLFSLAGKVVIFDEIHAYDFFMFNIFELLLKHLKNVHADVILLSATLPTLTKERLLKIWSDDLGSIPSTNYPNLTYATDVGVTEHNFEACSEKEIHLNFIEDDNNTIAMKAVDAFRLGARTAIVCNTVDKCQKIYKIIADNLNGKKNSQNLYILHSRFFKKDREQIEGTVLERFGKDTNDLSPAIIVATQIIEQSLDLDFDYMISDLAPIDLLIQRAGRIHRHSAKNPARPQEYIKPKFDIVTPELDKNSLPNLKTIGYVYDEITLIRTYYKLFENKLWSFPGDYRKLVDSVYPDYPGEDDKEKIVATFDKLLADLSDEIKSKVLTSIRNKVNEDIESQSKVQQQSIPTPERFSDIYGYGNFKYEEENDSRKYLRAKTRQGEDSYNVCFLFRCNGRLYSDIDLTEEIIQSDFGHRNDSLSIKLLYNSISLSNDYIKIFLDESEEDFWEPYQSANSVLKHHKLMIIDDLEVSIKDNFSVKYDKTLGLIFGRS